MVDIRATLTFGSFHDVDSSELSFKLAASKAFQEACRKAQAALLEPIMKVEVNTPEDIWVMLSDNLTLKEVELRNDW